MLVRGIYCTSTTLLINRMTVIKNIKKKILIALPIIFVIWLIYAITYVPSYKEKVSIIRDMFPIIKNDLDTIRKYDDVLVKNREGNEQDWAQHSIYSEEQIRSFFYGDGLPEEVLAAVNNLFYNKELPMNARFTSYDNKYQMKAVSAVLMDDEHYYDYVIYYYEKGTSPPKSVHNIYNEYLDDGYWLFVFERPKFPNSP